MSSPESGTGGTPDLVGQGSHGVDQSGAVEPQPLAGADRHAESQEARREAVKVSIAGVGGMNQMAQVGSGEPDGDVNQKRPPLFCGISPTDYQRISMAARIKEFGRGEMLFIEGDPVEQVILLTSGFAKITQLGTNGSQVILRFGTPGDVLGACGLFANGVHCRSAEAFRVCRALVWDARTFKGLVDRFPILHQNMARLIGEDLLELEERFREVATERVAPRVARQLIRLLDKIGRNVNGEIEVCLSREDLAQMTGTTLFTVSRLFSAWEARGMVRPRRESVTVCDIPLLRSISE